MPATGLRIGPPFLLLLAAGPLFAAEPADAVERAAAALGDGDIKAFAAAFDLSAPGLAQMRAQAAQLVGQADAQSNIEFRGESGDNRVRTLQLDWELRITDKESQAATRRQARVTCRVELRGGEWRILSLEPRDFFRPPHVGGAWNVLESAAAALSDGNAAGFLAYFSKSMPGYTKVENGAVAMVAEGEVRSSIDLLSDQGTDTSRTIDVNWALSIVSEDTQIRRGAREQRVTCRMELQNKQWRIAAVEPVDFFSAISLAALQREGRRALLERQLKSHGLLRRNIMHRDTDRAQPRSPHIG